jgi:hypothetical protein
MSSRWRSWSASWSAQRGGEANVTKNSIAVSIEAADKKSFATAVDWPGWSRSGKTEALAIEGLVEHADRYAAVARRARLDFPSTDGLAFEVVERIEGTGATAFGVPEKVTDQDRRPVSAGDGDRLAGLVEAAWKTFDSMATSAPEALRKGPRGGGRDTSKILDHVFGAEQSYASNMGIRMKAFATDDRKSLEALRSAILEILRQPTDGSPIAGRKWTTRYAAHRIAWHALDHAWEIENRTE